VHRVEAQKPSNTARLAARALSRASFHVRGADAPREPPPPEGRRLVLFPAEGARPLVPGEGLQGDPVQLIVPDGTWSQARRMARRDPWTLDAETVCLPEGPPTRYNLRRNTRPEGLCTLEAIARALAVIERPDIEPMLLATLTKFLERSHLIRTGVAPFR
jgi:DTW domain-containing protein YfiP